MDTRPLAAPQAPAASVRNTMRFEGSTGEYFKIWIVNIALTIVTFGIFSAWAKVRSKRYFYGNTYIGSHAFDYHAAPLRILIGRAIVAVFLLAYFFTATIAPKFIGLWYLLFLAALPWLIKSSLRFAARNTSYCNVCFDFRGTYWGACKAFILWQVLAVITLFSTLPFAHRARDYYTINNSSFGQMPFRAAIPVGKLYKYYGLTLLAILGALAMLVASTGGTLNIFKPDGLLLVTARAVAVIFGAIAFWGAPAYLGALTFNLALNNTRLGKDISFVSQLSPARMTWIIFSNILLTAISLGLLYPWARIRRARYMADCITVVGPADIDAFQSLPVPSGNAIGEEVASFLDIDFGL